MVSEHVTFRLNRSLESSWENWSECEASLLPNEKKRKARKRKNNMMGRENGKFYSE